MLKLLLVHAIGIVAALLVLAHHLRQYYRFLRLQWSEDMRLVRRERRRVENKWKRRARARLAREAARQRLEAATKGLL